MLTCIAIAKTRMLHSRLSLRCSKSTIKTLQPGKQYVQSEQKRQQNIVWQYGSGAFIFKFRL